MRRLVYAPKAYIFIRSSNLGGKIYDVSADVVRGSVTQKLGDFSSAHFEVRNRYQKYLRDPDSGNRSIFLPMDMVTIWLQRVAGRPVQVFTGYLDSVPYYQGYPGNAVFEATCTLKKLAYTWFDPGLPTFTQWVKTNDGWFFNPATGEGINAPARVTGELVRGTAALQASGKTGQINDSGFANLLGRFMTDIAGWSADDVLISELPSDIPQAAAQLWNTLQNDTQQDIKALEDYFKVTMGVAGWANPDAASTDQNGNPVVSPTIKDIVTRMQKIADKNNVPILVLAFAAFVNTAFDESWNEGPDSGLNNWGYGIFALQPPANEKGVATLDGKKPSDLLDVAVSTQVFCKMLNAAQGPWVKGAKANDLWSMKTWVEKALGRALPNVDYTAAFSRAKTASSIAQVVGTASATPSVAANQISFQSASVQRALTHAEQKIVSGHYNATEPWLAQFVLVAKAVTRDLILTAPAVKNRDVIAFTGPAKDMQKVFNLLKGKTNITEVALWLSGANEPQVMRNGVISNVKTSLIQRVSTIVIQQAKNPNEQGTSNTGGSGGSGGAGAAASTDTTGGGITFANLATFSANATFAANFAFPTNVAESKLLTGNRALMNDISCLEGVKQFTKASLRTFRSLPDGRFLAFYPDYFGAHRAPYWKIYNIELTDFGIQLNDESLATHVYVVGDTFANDGQITMMDDISTRGVATITQAFMLNSFIEGYTPPENDTGPHVPPAIGRLQDGFAFLQHYGARPHKEDEPMIRNIFYEFLMAWQKFMYLWAQQFATNVTFTFQPEVMAGGLIEFPDHDVQMFCEEVTHNFDYTSGFDTTAILTAPSLTKAHEDRTHKPGFALGGNVNTVGVEG